MNSHTYLSTGSGKIRLLVAAGSLTLLSACANFQGIESQAQLKSVPANTLQCLAADGNWPDQSWIKEIGGSDLQQLIQTAMRNNPGIQAAATRIAVARAMQDVAHANTLPAVNGSLESTYQRFTENGLIPPPLAGNYETDNEAAIQMSYELDFWGKHSAELRTAISAEKAALAEQESAKLLLANAIARSWVQLQRQYQQLALSEEQLAVRNKIDQISAQRLKAGLDNRSELQQNVVLNSNLKNDITLWKEAIALTRNQLAALAGQTPDFAASIPQPQLTTTTNVALPTNLPLELISRKPEIVAARWRVEASSSEIDIAKTQFYPNINLVGFVGLSSLGFDTFLKSDSRVIGAGPAIHLPIFEGGRLRAQLKGKVADYDAAVYSYNQSIINALHEVADQVQSAQTSQAQASQQLTAEHAALNVLQLAKQRYQAGTTSVLPVLAAESALLTQKKLTVDIRSKQTDARVNLIKALGGGYQDKLPAATEANETNNTISHHADNTVESVK